MAEILNVQKHIFIYLPFSGDVDDIKQSQDVLMSQVLHDNDLTKHTFRINLKQTKQDIS